jgi:hypothetical protein
MSEGRKWQPGLVSTTVRRPHSPPLLLCCCLLLFVIRYSSPPLSRQPRPPYFIHIVVFFPFFLFSIAVDGRLFRRFGVSAFRRFGTWLTAHGMMAHSV